MNNATVPSVGYASNRDAGAEQQKRETTYIEDFNRAVASVEEIVNACTAVLHQAQVLQDSLDQRPKPAPSLADDRNLLKRGQVERAGAHCMMSMLESTPGSLRQIAREASTILGTTEQKIREIQSMLKV
jgi:hypothetical protein